MRRLDGSSIATDAFGVNGNNRKKSIFREIDKKISTEFLRIPTTTANKQAIAPPRAVRSPRSLSVSNS
ncbi:hypothetical protein V0288_04270 [Pannus brasiliensis CCIBt3594]|uniref:Uncharacterized protein n=1 Tax=Pannus brasiliensis CCIBt3594 TaxID=1427578 RepID=A0AAW9QSL1_9CHRO